MFVKNIFRFNTILSIFSKIDILDLLKYSKKNSFFIISKVKTLDWFINSQNSWLTLNYFEKNGYIIFKVLFIRNSRITMKKSLSKIEKKSGFTLKIKNYRFFCNFKSRKLGLLKNSVIITFFHNIKKIILAQVFVLDNARFPL